MNVQISIVFEFDGIQWLYIYIFVGVLTQTVNQRQSRGRETVGTVGSRICDYAGECYHYTTALHSGIQCQCIPITVCTLSPRPNEK